jgi:predicted NAD-dependent protein-ADP-ribosyltransferase YbiA (DUF1768 family)
VTTPEDRMTETCWPARPPASRSTCCCSGATGRSDGRVGAGCLSQWWPAPFELDGVRYETAEHWMMAGKARLFGDAEGLAAVLAVTSPGAAKAAGRRVRDRLQLADEFTAVAQTLASAWGA